MAGPIQTGDLSEIRSVWSQIEGMALYNFEVDKMSIILCYNDENKKQLLDLLGTDDLFLIGRHCFKICPIVPNLNVPNRYHPHGRYFTHIANITP